MIGLILSFVASYALSVLTASQNRTNSGAEATDLSNAQIPNADPSGPIPVLFGERLITSPNCTWYGDLKTTKIKKAVGRKYGLFGPKEHTTVGYHYYLGMHLIVAAEVDAITEVRVGDKTIWSGNADSNQQLYVDKNELFGGNDSEGGIRGHFDVCLGAADQLINDYLQGHQPGLTPAYRGVAGLVLRRMYLGTSLYLKAWHIRARRIPGWYSDKANIDGGTTGAHIIYELITNADWGMGYTDQDVDQDAFKAAADTLYDEGAALSILWQNQTSIEDFCNSILEHINGSLYVDLETGLFTLTLLRADYDVDSVPVFDESNVLSVTDYSRSALGELTSQVQVVYQAADDNTSTTVTATDIALATAQGAMVSTTNQYNGVANGEQANRLAWRDLAELSTPLAKLKIKAKRDASTLRVGSPFVFSWSPLGIVRLPMRVAQINYGTLTDGSITVQATQDVFGLDKALYSAPTGTAWTSPRNAPASAPQRVLREATYRQIIDDIIGADQWAEVTPSSGFVTTLASKPSGDSLGYTLADRSGSDAFVQFDDQTFTPSATVAAAVGPADVSLSFATAEDVEESSNSQLAYLEDEIVLVTSIDSDGATIARGMLDTVPASHPAGARLWLFDNDQLGVDDDQAWPDGSTVDVRLMPATLEGELALTDAPTDQITMNHRAVRPYPPGHFRANGDRAPVFITGALSLAWAHRDRTQQLTGYTLQTDPSIGPEDGASYKITIRGEPTWALDPSFDDASGLAYSDANHTVLRTSGGGWYSARATQSVSAGKWYWEVQVIEQGTADGFMVEAFGTGQSARTNGGGSGDCYAYDNAQRKRSGNVYQSYGAKMQNGDTVGVALDMDARTIEFYLNGVSQGIAYNGIAAPLWPGLSFYIQGLKARLNLGDSAFDYPVPDGFQPFIDLPSPERPQLRSQSGLGGTDYTYPIDTEIADSGLDRPNESMSIEIVSQLSKAFTLERAYPSAAIAAGHVQTRWSPYNDIWFDGDRTVVIITGDPQSSRAVAVFDRITGEQLRSTHVADNGAVMVGGSDGFVYVARRNDTYYGLQRIRISDLTVEQTVEFDDIAGVFWMAFAGGLVWICGEPYNGTDPFTRAYAPGDLSQQFQAPWCGQRALTVGGHLYALVAHDVDLDSGDTVQAGFYELDLTDGSRARKLTQYSASLDAFGVAGGYLIVVTSSKIYCYDGATLALQWVQPAGDDADLANVDPGHFVVLGDRMLMAYPSTNQLDRSYLYLVDSTTGKRQSSYETDAGTAVDVVFAAGDDVYIQFGDNEPSSSVSFGDLIAYNLAIDPAYTSWQAQHIDIPECRGYGMFYGAYYGQ